jgi:murein L,D-transpeptidase YcbB/YkuD
VVGKNENYTPILNDTLYSVIFNPSWNVPASIATKEMLPKIRKDPGYPGKNNYVLLKGSYVSKDTVNPGDVDWKEVTKRNIFPLLHRSEPGKANLLGKTRVYDANQYNFYLHDTRPDHLFNEAQR